MQKCIFGVYKIQSRRDDTIVVVVNEQDNKNVKNPERVTLYARDILTDIRTGCICC